MMNHICWPIAVFGFEKLNEVAKILQNSHCKIMMELSIFVRFRA